jgi:hypothetical protein
MPDPAIYEERVVSASVPPELFRALTDRAAVEHVSRSALIRKALIRDLDLAIIDAGRCAAYGKRTGAGRPRKAMADAR